MVMSSLEVLLNNVSGILNISASNALISQLAERYYLKISEVLKLLKPLLDDIIAFDLCSDELVAKFEELDAVLNKANEVIVNWHVMTSKICFALEVEKLAKNIRNTGIEICKLLEVLLPSLPDAMTVSHLENCGRNLKLVPFEEVSNAIQESLDHVMAGAVPSSEILSKIADSLSLVSNQELLLEAVTLDRAKGKTGCVENSLEMEYLNRMIALIELMHERFLKANQQLAVNGVRVPADFCCPLSLELMSDPVIVHSGQTYERAFIKKWLDRGITVCPKTRQALSHTNLITNYTVKALIANWCESNNIKLPDPAKADAVSQSPVYFANGNSSPIDCIVSHPSQVHHAMHLEPNGNTGYQSSEDFDSSRSIRVPLSCNDAMTESDMSKDEAHGLYSVAKMPSLSRRYSTSNVLGTSQLIDFVSNNSDDASSVDTSETSCSSGQVACQSSTVSGELACETPALHWQPKFSSPSNRESVQSKSQPIWFRKPDKQVPRVLSTVDSNPQISAVEDQVKELIGALQSTSIDIQRDAAAELRLLARHNMDNRIVIASCGAICHLVSLLYSPDSKTQENAVTALLNLTLNDNNKTAIADAGAIDPLIHVLRTGNSEAKENAAATLYSLSVMEENKVKIGQSDAIGPLVELLGNGTLRGKKDAVTALFNLSTYPENNARIVQAGAIRHLVDLMDPAAGMVDKAVAVLANLAALHEGRVAIDREGGIPVLVEVVELGSSRGKENAAAALVHLCRNSNKFCSAVLREGAVPPLVALSQTGTPRAKEKAQTLLNFFRNQRHGHGGRV